METPIELSDGSTFYPAKREGLNLLGIREVKIHGKIEYNLTTIIECPKWTGCPEWANYMVKTSMVDIWAWIYTANKPKKSTLNTYIIDNDGTAIIGGQSFEGPFGFVPIEYHPKWGTMHSRPNSDSMVMEVSDGAN